ncbi:hypothetical protein OUZ56_028125 [Daphnia magna]|uniref:WAP domain-containing protein n=1 Tax=Daphnia magna TaxID=35525 RepID=A0ABR0B2X9_9CRUS|nr:hypothetical protein OUZ56_028125 [Daphnia magna]
MEHICKENGLSAEEDSILVFLLNILHRYTTMSTKMALIFVAISLIALSIVPDSVDACRPVDGFCRDGTRGTPCCGKGRCNIFCRNCNGGCRRGKTDVVDDGPMDSLETVATANDTESSGFSGESMNPIALAAAEEAPPAHTDETDNN